MRKSRKSAERELEKLKRTLHRPRDIQKFLRTFPYNRELNGDSLCSAVSALANGTMHCLEASFVAAALMEKRGHPPFVLSLESLDLIDHVVYIFQENGKWGAIGRSREEGLHGRAPIFRSVRDLALSYYDPFVDKTGKLLGYQAANIDESGVDWRYSKTHVWQVENFLLEIPHHKLPAFPERFHRLRKRYCAGKTLPPRPFWW